MKNQSTHVTISPDHSCALPRIIIAFIVAQNVSWNIGPLSVSFGRITYVSVL